MSDAVTEIRELQAEVKALALQVGKLEDANEIKYLQYSYGYFMDKGLYAEVVDLYADDGVLSFMGGLFRGRESVRRLYCDRLRKNFTHGENNPVYGLLVDHMQSQGVITIADDRHSAKGRFRCLLQGGSHKTRKGHPPHLPQQWWEAGVYENEYMKEDGTWKIKLLNYNLQWQCTYEEGWANSGLISTNSPKTYPEDPVGPDELHAVPPKIWPETYCVPFHYPHPVTGKPVKVKKA